ncbi:MAG: glycoside hydrolase family 57 protein [Deltaproteobacteria bacterium]|nr:glycoside hydrolase family 57 protein [Deltaproteobacteria bacterium]MBN2674425.1 glycoside hydrolase family 57 protein [Deltaproteobacteria bacterium]
MVNLCFYFQVHQPNRLKKYSYFQIGRDHFYEDDEKNGAIMKKVAQKCYLPTNRLMLSLIERYNGAFRISYSISGVCIDQMKKFSPETLDTFKALADTGCVEFIDETYNHSLAFLFSKDEFVRQVQLHAELMKQEFGQTPTTFRNTELIYNNDVALAVEKMGYKTILAEGADHILDWRSPNFMYQPQTCNKLKLLLKNYKLSDDIAFRFSNKGWESYPLTAEKFANWVHAINGAGETVNLFMDYETFGEHQWEDSGIFNFMEHLPDWILKNPDFRFATPAEVSASLSPVAKLNVPDYISWADVERDLSAWRGNHLQDDALAAVFSLEERVLETKNEDLIRTWRSLQTSDHFYYMCTKWFADGDVHKYFNPYSSPYDAYINYQNVLADFETTLDR